LAVVDEQGAEERHRPHDPDRASEMAVEIGGRRCFGIRHGSLLPWRGAGRLDQFARGRVALAAPRPPGGNRSSNVTAPPGGRRPMNGTGSPSRKTGSHSTGGSTRKHGTE